MTENDPLERQQNISLNRRGYQGDQQAFPEKKKIKIRKKWTNLRSSMIIPENTQFAVLNTYDKIS